MFEVKGLKDYGTWLRKGETCYCPDHVAFMLARTGVLQIKGYHTMSVSAWQAKDILPKLKEQAEALKYKIEAYEKLVKKGDK